MYSKENQDVVRVALVRYAFIACCQVEGITQLIQLSWSNTVTVMCYSGQRLLTYIAQTNVSRMIRTPSVTID